MANRKFTNAEVHEIRESYSKNGPKVNMGYLARLMERDAIADDQMIALALAKLALERPGWRWTLRELCDARGWRSSFELFYSIHTGKRFAG